MTTLPDSTTPAETYTLAAYRQAQSMHAQPGDPASAIPAGLSPAGLLEVLSEEIARLVEPGDEDRVLRRTDRRERGTEVNPPTSKSHGSSKTPTRWWTAAGKSDAEWEIEVRLRIGSLVKLATFRSWHSESGGGA